MRLSGVVLLTITLLRYWTVLAALLVSAPLAVLGSSMHAVGRCILVALAGAGAAFLVFAAPFQAVVREAVWKGPALGAMLAVILWHSVALTPHEVLEAAMIGLVLWSLAVGFPRFVLSRSGGGHWRAEYAFLFVRLPIRLLVAAGLVPLFSAVLKLAFGVPGLAAAVVALCVWSPLWTFQAAVAVSLARG